jgi:hypothetical protein
MRVITFNRTTERFDCEYVVGLDETPDDKRSAVVIGMMKEQLSSGNIQYVNAMSEEEFSYRTDAVHSLLRTGGVLDKRCYRGAAWWIYRKSYTPVFNNFNVYDAVVDIVKENDGANPYLGRLNDYLTKHVDSYKPISSNLLVATLSTTNEDVISFSKVTDLSAEIIHECSDLMFDTDDICVIEQHQLDIDHQIRTMNFIQEHFNEDPGYVKLTAFSVFVRNARADDGVVVIPVGFRFGEDDQLPSERRRRYKENITADFIIETLMNDDLHYYPYKNETRAYFGY